MPEGEKVRLIGHWDGEEEARWIGEEIEALARGTRGLDPISRDGIAILVRASHQMRAFEDRFLTIGLPYRVIGGPRFYERQEIRDAMAYFRARGLARRRPRLRAHRQRPQARPRRQGGAGDQPHRPRRTASRCSTAPRLLVAERRPARRAPAPPSASFVAGVDRWHAADPRRRRPRRARRDHPRRMRLHRDVAGREDPRRRRAPRQPQGTGQGPRTSSRTCRASSSTSRSSWTTSRTTTPPRSRS